MMMNETIVQGVELWVQSCIVQYASSDALI